MQDLKVQRWGINVSTGCCFEYGIDVHVSLVSRYVCCLHESCTNL